MRELIVAQVAVFINLHFFCLVSSIVLTKHCVVFCINYNIFFLPLIKININYSGLGNANVRPSILKLLPHLKMGGYTTGE